MSDSTISDKNSSNKDLLQELKIDRGAKKDSSQMKWVAGIATVVVIATGAGFLKMSVQETPPIEQGTADGVAVVKAPQEKATRSTSILDATGYIVARRQATVSSKTTGKVIEVFIEEGDVVERGQLLARLDDSIPLAQYELAQSQLEASKAGLKELDVVLKQGKLDLHRTEGLAQRNLASQADFDRDSLTVEGLIARLERARKEIQVSQRSLAVQRQVLDDMQIRAPFAGVVVAKSAQPGEMISPISAGGGFTRTGICTLVDMNSLEVEVDVNEAYINRVQAKQGAQVILNAYPNERFEAQVIAIIPAADRNKATVRVRVGLLELDPRILPDMGVRVAFLDVKNDRAEEPTLQDYSIDIEN